MHGMGRVRPLRHTDPAVAAQVLAVLRPAAAQEAGWLGLPEAGNLPPTTDAASTRQTHGKDNAEDGLGDELAQLGRITASTQLHLGAWLGEDRARRIGVADPRLLAGVLALAPEAVTEGPPGAASGAAALAPVPRLCIGLLVVAPWAQRQGLGRALVQAALQHGRGWGFSVTAASANRAALALYLGLGFVPGRQGLLGAARVPVVQLLRAPEAAAGTDATVAAGPPWPTPPARP